MELAPVLGLSDLIVDLVNTGNTLKENRLGGAGNHRGYQFPPHCQQGRHEDEAGTDKTVHKRHCRGRIGMMGIARLADSDPDFESRFTLLLSGNETLGPGVDQDRLGHPG